MPRTRATGLPVLTIRWPGHVSLPHVDNDEFHKSGHLGRARLSTGTSLPHSLCRHWWSNIALADPSYASFAGSVWRLLMTSFGHIHPNLSRAPCTLHACAPLSARHPLGYPKAETFRVFNLQFITSVRYKLINQDKRPQDIQSHRKQALT